jgi:hypothetical protein
MADKKADLAGPGIGRGDLGEVKKPIKGIPLV